VHLFGFIIRIYHDVRSSECQIYKCSFGWNIEDVFDIICVFVEPYVVEAYRPTPGFLALPIYIYIYIYI